MKQFGDEHPTARDEMYAVIYKACPDAVFGVDTNGRINFCTPQAERLFGATHDQLIGLEIEALVPDAVRIRHATDRSVYQHNNPVARPMGHGLKLAGRRLDDGSEFAVDISLTPVILDGEEYVVAWVRDMSQRQFAYGMSEIRDVLIEIASGSTFQQEVKKSRRTLTALQIALLSMAFVVGSIGLASFIYRL